MLRLSNPEVCLTTCVLTDTRPALSLVWNFPEVQTLRRARSARNPCVCRSTEREPCSALRCCSPSACSGLQATPVPFRLGQCPPVAYLSCTGFPNVSSRLFFTSGGVAALFEVDFDLSVPGVVRASLPSPRVDSRHGSMSACFGLQATPDSYYAARAAFVRRISTPWLPSSYARLPHRFRGSAGFSAVLPLPIQWLSTLRFPRPGYEPHFNAFYSLSR